MAGEIRRYLADRSCSAGVLEPEDLGRPIALDGDGGFGDATGQVIRADGPSSYLASSCDDRLLE